MKKISFGDTCKRQICFQNDSGIDEGRATQQSASAAGENKE